MREKQIKNRKNKKKQIIVVKYKEQNIDLRTIF